MLKGILLKVIHPELYCAEGHSAECHCAEGHSAGCHSAESHSIAES
jgi:hypothetical protein